MLNVHSTCVVRTHMTHLLLSGLHLTFISKLVVLCYSKNVHSSYRCNSLAQPGKYTRLLYFQSLHVTVVQALSLLFSPCVTLAP